MKISASTRRFLISVVFSFLSTKYCAAYYAAMGNVHPLVICDSLNVDIQSLFALPADDLVFPSALAETRCVAINTCSGLNQRGETVPPNVWMHRSAPSLQFDDEYVSVESGNYNHHSVQYARIPEGIQLSACQPDFDHLRVQGGYICNKDLNATRNISGRCPVAYPSTVTPSWPSNAVGFLACLASLQHDSGQAVLPENAIWGTVTYPIAATVGSTQMIHYAFEDGYGCFDASDLSPGLYLSATMPPNRILSCPELSIGTYTNDFSSDCVFACPVDYIVDTESQQCAHKCANTTSTACENGFYAAIVCGEGSVPFYSCTACAYMPGQYSTAWNPSNPTQCVYADCPAGTFSESGVCVPCALNSYTESGGQTTCAACAYGKYTEAQGATSCVQCFEQDITGATCEDGASLSFNLSFIEQYFQTSASEHIAHFTLETFCAQGYACLPCSPGHYEASGLCVACEIATYQPNFKQTDCFSCGDTKTTLQQATKTAEECVCTEGHE